MGRDRRQQEGSVLAKKQFSSHVQPSSSLGSGNATSDPRLSPVVVDSLPGSSPERCVKEHGPTIARKTVCTGHDRDGDRVFLESVPRTQAFRRLAFSHRPIGAQQIRSAENLRDGHDGEGQESSASGHVGHLARPLRCILSYTDKAAQSEVSVLPSRRNKVHVHGPAIWIDDSPVVVKQIKKWTIPRRYVLFQYLDDWLNAHLNKNVLVRKTDALVRLYRRLGLLVNEKKSCSWGNGWI